MIGWAEPGGQGVTKARSKRVLEHLPAAQKVVVRVGGEVPAGAALAEAHGIWTAARVAGVQTPGGLPRQLEDARCPPGLVRVSIECVRRPSGGMSSYYGFEGYFLSALLLLDDAVVWDARGEEATG